MMACLDTSVLIALIRKDQTAVDRLSAEADRNGVVSTTMINLCELYSGAYGFKEPQKELARVQELVSKLELLELDAGAARRYGELVNNPSLKREPIGDFDLIIASIALEHDEKLVTRNTRHFSRVPELVIERW
jgi:tRNA(fMet)-specific endonuclease VapC